ncbi:MAG: glycosyltransferase family 1 protein, partial [Chlamydiae bacterium]|nr:glycosyltransferase family 1 protein [Chlamydiota bacterium]
ETCEAVFQGESQIAALFRILKREKLNVGQVPFCVMHKQITMYLKGRDRVELIRSIKKFPVHIFGRHHLNKGWEAYLEGQSNVHFHPQVSFEKSLEIMRKSKVLLNGAPQFMWGLHERIFNGLGSGALVLTNDNHIMKHCFQNKEEILLYTLGQYDDVEENLSYYLKQNQARRALVEKGAKKVREHHTWDHRAEVFIEKVNHILEGV